MIGLQLDIDQFLMFELSQICGEIEDQELRAYAIAMTISASGTKISESWLKIYLSNCAVDKEQMDIHIAVFNGMNLLIIDCDCESYDRSCMSNRFKIHPGYKLGQKYLENISIEYLDASHRIDALKEDLLS